jgi:hypothetical protein
MFVGIGHIGVACVYVKEGAGHGRVLWLWEYLTRLYTLKSKQLQVA